MRENIIHWITGAALSLCFGFLGGYAAFRLANRPAPSAVLDRSQVVRASRFELVNETGRLLASWSADSANGSVTISFLDEFGKVRTTLGTKATEFSSSRIPAHYAPILELRGDDGGDRVVLHTDRWDKPVLGMSAADWEGRIVIGHDAAANEGSFVDSPVWALAFTTPDRAATAVFGTTEAQGIGKATSFMGLRNAQSYWTVEPSGVQQRQRQAIKK